MHIYEIESHNQHCHMLWDPLQLPTLVIYIKSLRVASNLTYMDIQANSCGGVPVDLKTDSCIIIFGDKHNNTHVIVRKTTM